MNNRELITRFEKVLSSKYVLTGNRKTERFRRGFRSGDGEAAAVLRPGKLRELWEVLKLCVAADKIVIMQAANTGLTEGSTPSGIYDRDVILINTNRMSQIHLMEAHDQVVCFPGATLFSLEKLLAPSGRQPHSVIGSSCIGASVVGGVCNNSGGSLLERGPSYTEMSLFARISADGELELVNHLGIALGNTPEDILENLERGNFGAKDFETTNRKASDTEYASRLRDVEADTPARFNADKRRLYEASGCAGKIAVFAVRLDTYPKNEREQVFYIGTNDPAELTDFRRAILRGFGTLPVSAEYMHREMFDIALVYGKDTVVMIDKLGTDRLPVFFALKGTIDAWLNKLPLFPKNFSDRSMQFLSRLWPRAVPPRLIEFREQFEHHLILKCKNDGIEEAEAFLAGFFDTRTGDYFACTPREGKIAGLHRFAAAGAAIRFQAIHASKVEGIIPLDLALPRNDQNWFEDLPTEISDKILRRLYYGHFLCHVLHQEYVVKKGVDMEGLKTAMLKLLDQRGAEYPAEHNVGHLYRAKPDLADFYQSIDPTNSFNPGLGKMSKVKNYAA